MSALKSIFDCSKNELYHLAADVKEYCDRDPVEAHAFLKKNVEFARVVAQAQYLLGMHDTSNQNVLSSQESSISGIQLDSEQRELLQQVQNLTPEIIHSLPQQQKQQILELRKAIGLPPI